ncbi:TIGR00730 family Rossman fold protein [Pelagicoccus albus]|uniref:Cytokinin riboside 5'-monophosphate phosphoribohydrolase n=1 Tax=Pelagicoccus albus TaxID=415222 RepID=A0A7X1B930_9BACT|nr:TIGR00730 family Rossman fold protein [Pelagicoccus albus]MBC2607931.1 TIGR00730 family Rossman fold protein [Pelagicoccus albus]
MTTNSIKSIAVYCGSNTGAGTKYMDSAKELGTLLAKSGIRLIYGGTHKGLMGAIADAVLENGGEAYGVITERLLGKGHLHDGLTGHEVTATMKERKHRMAQLADAFIGMPGGIGTMEEFLEVWTLNQLGDLDKPPGLFSVDGYFEPFMGFIDHMIQEAFLPAAHRNSVVVESDAKALLEGLLSFEKVTVPKWL